MASDITINIPIDYLQGLDDFTPFGIQAYFADIRTDRLEVETAKAQLQTARNNLTQWAAELQDALDNSPDEFTKVRRLRELVNVTRGV